LVHWIEVFELIKLDRHLLRQRSRRGFGPQAYWHFLDCRAWCKFCDSIVGNLPLARG